ncbi:MAG: PKD domain-containing protein, partial [Chitinophagales bacterium]
MKASRHTQFLLTSLFFFVFSSFDFSLQAFHIVGGEVTYECINEPNGTYRINLTIYRDCAGQGAPFDSIGYIFIYENGSNALTNTLEALHNPSQIENVNPPTDICLETLPDVCIEVYTYQEIVTNLTSSAGYTIVYQRYSRNVGILNLVSSGMVGSSYVATIPPTDLAVCNTSAVFNELPPTVICAGAPLYINQSATDEDGDSLVYELCSSLVGGTSFCVQPGSPVYCDPPNDPAPPPPYDIVPYAPGFSGENPVTSEPALSINPVTGLLTGTPTQTGLFVVGICVREFRNGVEIGITNRDFQFTVADCSVISAAVQSDDISAAGEFLITNCDDFTVSFSNTSIGAVSYEWMFDDFPSGTANFSDLINPTHEYPDSGQYNVTLVANSNIDGCVDTAYIILNLYPTLQADFGFGTGCAMTPITFQDLSTSTYGEVVEWEWDMGDSTIITGEAMPEYSYAEGGTYNVTLSTTTSVGCTDQKVLAVTVDPVPIADFTTTLRCPGQPIDFVDASTEANVVSWSWDFGDPDNSNDNSDNPTPSYTYYLPGSYEVFFTVVSDDGCEATYTETIDIYPEFVASVSENTMMCFSDSVQLVATDEFDFFSYAWSSPETMDDPTSQTPMVSPATTTTYTVTVSDPNGCLDVADVTVTVLPLPIVEVGAPSTICFGDTHTFS